MLRKPPPTVKRRNWYVSAFGLRHGLDHALNLHASARDSRAKVEIGAAALTGDPALGACASGALDSVPSLESAFCRMTVRPSLESYAQNQEDILAWDYFGHKTDGFFVEVGANHPTELSQTWFLEQRGWKGILVEPLPACCEKLRAVRKNSLVCEAAAGAPEQVGEATLNVAKSDVWSHLGEENKDLPLEARIKVAVRTLDSILEELRAPQVDLLSIDTEGMEIQV